ncbi:hypothetical protein [Desulfomonile tiedjei]|uniref:Uncharacterized protein n=1 Tax=Desulfomonile tiedjei (strain ATCC 49306 / DSM 6799 / DCB-1) TaxID=706587 RepID=I4C301_DESTA|nr:hypothetical protein [Desulfomonile tiedjei]AFM23942.1 hypothetical protein Desti_1229 [Desulfomonile tiedjei DSM 6799]
MKASVTLLLLLLCFGNSASADSVVSPFSNSAISDYTLFVQQQPIDTRQWAVNPPQLPSGTPQLPSQRTYPLDQYGREITPGNPEYRAHRKDGRAYRYGYYSPYGYGRFGYFPYGYGKYGRYIPFNYYPRSYSLRKKK